MRFVISLLTIVSLIACSIGPNYHRPDVAAPSDWRFPEKEAKDVINSAWWRQFQDSVLEGLVAEALRENKDLRAATARVEEFYGRYGAARASIFPQVNYEVSASRERSSEKGFTPVPAGTSPVHDTYKPEFTASWELDIWGRVRRATEAARAELLATEETRRGVILTLVTSVALAYIDLLSLDRQLEITKRTAASRQESLNYFKLRFSAGAISELELAQAQSEYFAALAEIPAIERSVVQQENALSVLLGRNPGPISRGKTIDAIALPAVPAGLPSALLEQRPDIRQAEQQLISANALIGIAKGLYFPSISLTGFFGQSSKELSDLFTGPARIWNYTGTLAGPIFTAGRIKNQVRASEAFRREALFNYQKAIQTGFQEVDNALVDQARSRVQLEAQANQVQALQRYAQLARLRYDNGYSSYIEVLDAERSLYNAELSYTRTLNTLFKGIVNLYKAIGGGWILEADRIAAEPTN